MNANNTVFVGDTETFAIHTVITQAFRNRSLLAIGCMGIFIQGRRYGLEELDASMLACSYDAIVERVRHRGTHVWPFCSVTGSAIAEAYQTAIYAPNGDEMEILGIRCEKVVEAINQSRIDWIPDGDAAFDDGSRVLQMDLSSCVRLVAFKSSPRGELYDSTTLTDLMMPAAQYYDTLTAWIRAFDKMWEYLPKQE